MNANHPDKQCRRCGTCCRKGGPVLHLQDLALITEGHISIAHLFTIRPGEPVHDNVRGVVAPAAEEMIKIRGRGGQWTCRFFKDHDSSCRIYDHRPVECIALCCRDTAALKKIYNTDRLARKRVLGHIEGLWQLVEAHQAHCDYRTVAASFFHPSPVDAGKISQMVRYDRALRALIVEKGLARVETLDFILGRPAADIVQDLKKFEKINSV